MPGPFDFAVLGAGLAGLTFAYEAARLGRRVAVLEKDAQVGGLARTRVYGDYRFDLGGHRFHSPDAALMDWVRGILDGRVVDVPRRSRILLNGRYVDYPLQFPSAVTGLGLAKGLRVLASYLVAAAGRGPGDSPSFEQWVVRRFGRALYEIYFRPYTEKVWGIACDELSADWASQRIRVPSLMAAVLGSLTRIGVAPSALVSHFLYPPRGCGELCEALADKAGRTGRVEIVTGAAVQSLAHDPVSGWTVRHGNAGATLAAAQVVSTIPLTRLVACLPDAGRAPRHRLDYRGVRCVFLAIDRPTVSADTWCYFPDRQLTFGRIHEPRNWSAEMAPPGRTSLCLELFCSAGDATWNQPDAALVAAVTADLARMDIVQPSQIAAAWVAGEAHAYPIYRVGYAEELQRVRAFLRRWPSLHLCGRTGSFNYLNMDKTIAAGLGLARGLATGA